MAKAIMIQGTTSNAGKSLVTAGLCRIFAQDGYKVAPFKSQNMALNSYITKDGFEMGRAQVVQAQAAYKEPDIRMNPVLLKPTSDKGSQVIVNGEVLGNMTASEYFKYKKELIPQITKAYESLALENDIIVIEGAGSPAEINLKEQDIVNMGMAKIAKAPVLIVGDIDRGGVFAALYGTYMLQEEDEKRYIKGNIINKFRGDKKILEPGLKMFEELIPVPTLGVIPYAHLDIDDEDSLSEKLNHNNVISNLDIVVIRLPRISNFTDFNAFEYGMGSKVRYVKSYSELKNPDLIIIPGTKNTLGDLKWLKESGLAAAIMQKAESGIPIFGICGGYQMLCKTLEDPYGVEEGGTELGLGFFDSTTVFETEKTRTQVNGKFTDIGGIFKSLSGLSFQGYEIHMGQTNNNNDKQKSIPLSTLQTAFNITKQDGQNFENIYGTYVHGIFDSIEILNEIAKALLEKKGMEFSEINICDINEYQQKEYDKLANLLRESLDMEEIYKILNKGMESE